jgi:hypothetical protein
MKMDNDLAAVHAYLCADGYVIKNPETQKLKYYRIGFRNTNLVLLKDFKKRFKNYFKIEPHLYEGERCQIGSKEIYTKLTEKFGSFYSWHWKMPQLDKKLLKIWLRAYFDCEGWVFCKTHQNRHIGVDCVNENGINQIVSSLEDLKIKTIKKFNKKRKIYRIIIYGKDNLSKFKEEINFLHPEKAKKLEEIEKDFIVYEWYFPKEKGKCKKFIKELLKRKIKIRKRKYIRIFSKEEYNLVTLSKLLKEFYKINSKVNKSINGLGTIFYELNIYKKEEIQKLINHDLIPNNINLEI